MLSPKELVNVKSVMKTKPLITCLDKAVLLRKELKELPLLLLHGCGILGGDKKWTTLI